jgi:hypothetical protein
LLLVESLKDDILSKMLTHISYFSKIQLMKLKSLSGMASADKLGEKYAEKGCYNFSQLIGKNLGISAGVLETRKWLNMVMLIAFLG